MPKPKKPRTILTDNDIRRVVRLYHQAGYSQGKLSQIFGVSTTYIGMIVRGEVRHSVNRRAVLEDRTLQPLSAADFEKHTVHDLLAKGYSIPEINSALDEFNMEPKPEPELEPEPFLPPVIPKRVSTTVRDFEPEEIEELEQEIDDGLQDLDIRADEIAAMVDEFEREEAKKLEQRLKITGASRKPKKPKREKLVNLKTLDELNEMEPGNKLIIAAMSDPDVEDATREVFSTLPRDVWDSPLPGILIEKTLKGER